MANLKLTEKAAYRLASEGKLVGDSWHFKREDLEAWIVSQKVENGQKRKTKFK
ncbi:DNA-binding protein [Vibrio sp. 378]|uniref:DNA-binding protein n=1 Tax=Vibrionaceae TaxID=641 RepID=UPI0029646D84|nr:MULTISPECIES: DNA-binding protein [Vibrionaceae]MDW2147340.1 DNA-binding protein [Vibrio sp. 378]